MMKLIFIQTKQSIAQFGKWWYIFVLLCSLSFGLQLFVSVASIQSTFSQKKYEQAFSQYQYFTVRDNFTGQSESELFRQKRRIEDLMQLEQAMRTMPQAKYFEIYAQNLMGKNINLPDELVLGYESGNTAPYKDIPITMETGESYLGTDLRCVWMDEAAFSVFPLRMAQGRGFSAEDYAFNDENPVMLIAGHAYSNHFKLGAIVEMDDYIGNTTGVIIGFLEPDMIVEENGRVMNLDRTIIHPMMNLKSSIESETEYFSQMILALMKINGAFQTKLSADALQSEIAAICMKLSLSPALSVSQANNTMHAILATRFNALAKELHTISYVIFGVLSLLSILATSLAMRAQKKSYRAILMAGGTPNFLKGCMLSFVLFTFAVSAAVAGIIVLPILFAIYGNGISLGTPLLLGCLLLLFLAIVIHVVLNHILAFSEVNALD